MPDQRVTVTFRFPKELNKNMKAYSVQHETTQNDIAVKAITRFLTDQGVNVSLSPRFFNTRHRAKSVNTVA